MLLDFTIATCFLENNTSSKYEPILKMLIFIREAEGLDKSELFSK